MKYKSVDELDKFSFKDCELMELNLTPEGIKLQVEALIVLPENSQNSNFTESYAGTTEIRLVGGTILSSVKDGYRYYDANDNLIDEVSDKELSENEIIAILKNPKNAFLYEIKKDSDCYVIAVEFADPEEYNAALDSYTLKVKADKIIVEWDIYMNRVQH